MRCSTIITCELLNYTVQRQVNGQATEYTAIQSDADKQVMTDKLKKYIRVHLAAGSKVVKIFTHLRVIIGIT